MKSSIIIIATLAALVSQGVTVKVDFSLPTGRAIKPVNGVGHGPILGWYDCSMFHYLQEAGVPYVRYHDVGGAFGGGRFVDVPNVFPDFEADENDPKNYDFAWTDKLVEGTCAHGAYPYYRLGVTIENKAREVGPRRILPPKDFAKWTRICEHIIAHYNHGWANGYKMGIPYWEIWNEPEGNNDDPNDNVMWHGTFKRYLELYETASKQLKAKFPEIKIGGFGSIGLYYALEGHRENPRNRHYHDRVVEFLDFCREKGCPLDFFSFHTYADGPWNYRPQIELARKLLDERGFVKTETSLNEWHEGAWRRDRGTARHGAAQTAVLLEMQRSSLDNAMFYDARVGTSVYGGMFNPMTLKPFKSYWGFRAFNELKLRGREVVSESSSTNVFVVAARGSADGAAVIVNYSDETVPFKADFGGCEITGARITDASRDFAPCRIPDELPPYSIMSLTVKMREELKDDHGNGYLFRAGDRGIASYRIPAVAKAKDGTLIVVCDERHFHAGDLHTLHPINIVARRSTDGGRTWSPAKPTWVWPWTDPERCPWDPHERWGASDPSLVADAKSGKVFLLCNVMEHVKGQGRYRKFVQETADGGLTWTKPREITANVGEKGFITSGRGWQLRDGTLAVVQTAKREDGEWCGYVIASTDGGRNWRKLSKEFAPANESKIVELKDGAWYVNARLEGTNGNFRAVHVSRDRGKTWESRIDRTLRDPHCNAALFADGDKLYFTNCDADTRTRATLRTSDDNGASWKTLLTLTEGPAAYSDLVKTADGDFLLVWEDDRGSILFRK